VDRFALVSAADLDAADLAQGSKPEFRRLSWTGPLTVGAKLPPLGKARTEILFSSVKGKDVDEMPKYYVDYSAVSADLLTKAKPVSALPVRDVETRNLLDTAVRKTGLPAERLVWVPVTALKANMIMLLDAQSGQPVRAAAVNPWAN
jgi:hypothetical protein